VALGVYCAYGTTYSVDCFVISGASMVWACAVSASPEPIINKKVLKKCGILPRN
jgi:hypothetical protein